MKKFREIVDSSEDAIMIHVNGTTLRFTIRDFVIISWLKCSDNESNFVFNIEEPNRIILQYFDAGKPITKKQLVDNFNNKVWGDNDDDARKFVKTKKDFHRLDYFAKDMFRDDNNPVDDVDVTPKAPTIIVDQSDEHARQSDTLFKMSNPLYHFE
ncbi:hypothetical protein KY290_014045 [Solanum tuberosum]|uniref:DUF1985 domain-containing protein n=1 Tax=Solanum tuberosum TaxID=4113 RepID=A0ABQ7VNJ0_SOLTU|nr:hypothetical protein KY289_014143 [Solanum tuberosum]KAH0770064.1 hypothetical protein KY290_014045 [Solanum tuberosum]